jgi:hypothetical protein
MKVAAAVRADFPDASALIGHAAKPRSEFESPVFLVSVAHERVRGRMGEGEPDVIVLRPEAET